MREETHSTAHTEEEKNHTFVIFLACKNDIIC